MPAQLAPVECPYKKLLAVALYELARVADDSEHLRVRAFRSKVKLIDLALELGVPLPVPTP